MTPLEILSQQFRALPLPTAHRKRYAPLPSKPPIAARLLRIRRLVSSHLVQAAHAHASAQRTAPRDPAPLSARNTAIHDSQHRTAAAPAQSLRFVTVSSGFGR